ncbi:MAG: hypothetical protein HZB31_10765 [Nitrospirae bacterium]|nr:hypothetical protein [Nitrospirota bacterium]
MVIERLKTMIGKGPIIKKADIARLSGLQSEEREKELLSICYELAFKDAAAFVYDGLRRPESPFSVLERNAFFHEMLIINFWMMDKVFSKYMKDLAENMHAHYFGSLSDIEERKTALAPKFKAYYLCWDEYTGHHDEFGLRVGEVLFGKEAVYPEKNVSFWIITYADDSIKKYRKLRAQCLEAGLIQKGE